jgi:glycosyltransferase involved in cell wall biosynthesis
VTDEIIGGPAAFGVRGPEATAETGLYVPPGDAAALRQAIEYLLGHPEQAAAMGAGGRRLVEQWMDLDRFVRRVAAVVQGEPERLPGRPGEGMDIVSGKASG